VHHEVLSEWSGILTKNIAGSRGIELPILFASIESIDTFVSIDDFDTFSIVSPITMNYVLIKMSYCFFAEFLYHFMVISSLVYSVN
jgi:hypothetical protein